VHAAVYGNAAEKAHDSRFLCKAFEKVRARMRFYSCAITSSPQVPFAFSLRALICVHARNLQADKVNCCCATPLFLGMFVVFGRRAYLEAFFFFFFFGKLQGDKGPKNGTPGGEWVGTLAD
jgi:hypothetical protein